MLGVGHKNLYQIWVMKNFRNLEDVSVTEILFILNTTIKISK